jgi:predicted GNAT family N-acyltransferase
MQRQYLQIDQDDLLPNLYHLCTIQQPKNNLTILRFDNDDNYEMMICKIVCRESVLMVSHESCTTLDDWYL